MINGLFGVRFLFSGTKMERCSIDDYSSILQRPRFITKKKHHQKYVAQFQRYLIGGRED